MDTETDEPLTPTGRLFLRPELNTIITCAIGVKNPIEVDAVKSQIRNSMLLEHPRFCSLMVKDRHGREHWRRTQVNLDQHIIIRHKSIGDTAADDEEAVNDYLADLSLFSSLSTDKPLWEIHLLMAQKCAIFRVHHALGDGISLMSMFLSCCRKADDPTQPATVDSGGSFSTSTRRNEREWKVWRLVKMLWYTLIFVFEFGLRSLWLKDKKTAVIGGAGVELWPRKLATAKFQLDDMKAVKNAVPHATINDVLFGVVSSGLSKYLDLRMPKALREGLQLTGVAMVNLRPQPGLLDPSKLMRSNSEIRWGNKFGMLLLPVYYHRSCTDPLHFLTRAKAMIDRKKLSLEALFSYKIGNLVMSCLGPKYASMLNYRILCNTTFTISNVLGPREEITIAANPITYIRANTSSLPHAITMHMLSYAGRADMQILVAKEIIPDPEVLARCFEDALLELKKAAEIATKT